MSPVDNRATATTFDPSIGLDDETIGQVATIADLASNTRENDTARIFRRYCKYIVSPNAIPALPNTFEHIITLSGSTHDSNTSSSLDINRKLMAPAVPARRASNISSYHAIQEWEGYVTSISPKIFTADLVDKTNPTQQAEEQVELSLDEIGDDQSCELRIGAVFRWTIGYDTLASGQKRRVSQVVFRQLPKWTRADIDAAKKRGAERHSRINWE